ncbi:hypothetical protein ACR91X_24740 [Klebsiella pneumoniae]
MPRARREPMDIITSIVEKRQPLSLRDVRYYAHCYVAMREWSAGEMYAFVREHFSVDEKNKVTLRGE